MSLQGFLILYLIFMRFQIFSKSMVFFYTYPTLLQRLLRPKLLGLSPVAQTLSNHRGRIYWMENIDLVGIQLQQIAQYPPPDPTASV